MNATMGKISLFLRTLPQRIRNSPADEKLAYYTIFVGIFLLIVGMIVNIAL